MQTSVSERIHVKKCVSPPLGGGIQSPPMNSNLFIGIELEQKKPGARFLTFAAL